MSKGDFGDVNWGEVIGAAVMSASVGVVRALYLVRRGRKFKWIDIMLEPAMAVIGGMSMWAIAEVSPAPDLIQAVLTSLGAWGGPKTIHWLELRYFGGTRKSDTMQFTAPGDLGD
jgi:hypothetical protein